MYSIVLLSFLQDLFDGTDYGTLLPEHTLQLRVAPNGKFLLINSGAKLFLIGWEWSGRGFLKSGG